MHYGRWQIWQVWRSIPWSGIPWLEVQSGPCSSLQEGVTPLLHQCCRSKSRHEAEQAPQCRTSLSLVKPSKQSLNCVTEPFGGSRNRTWLLFLSFCILMAAATVNYDKLLFVHLILPSVPSVCWGKPRTFPSTPVKPGVCFGTLPLQSPSAWSRPLQKQDIPVLKPPLLHELFFPSVCCLKKKVFAGQRGFPLAPPSAFHYR